MSRAEPDHKVSVKVTHLPPGMTLKHRDHPMYASDVAGEAIGPVTAQQRIWSAERVENWATLQRLAEPDIGQSMPLKAKLQGAWLIMWKQRQRRTKWYKMHKKQEQQKL